jgi:hypothetical protein
MIKEKDYNPHTDKRVREVQARNATRNANPKRRYHPDAMSAFIKRSSQLVDFFARMVEREKRIPTGYGIRGTNITEVDVDQTYFKFKSTVRDFLDMLGEEE